MKQKNNKLEMQKNLEIKLKHLVNKQNKKKNAEIGKKESIDAKKLKYIQFKYEKFKVQEKRK
ncbi:hypothetical protein Mgra_00000740 [Meloidogyne graminicola]|uniref:Uncharacterized protein n=1 Tax=Meloidogyne graminicola TaxID=189291 RepID=A0A8T0A2N7_9BILA|nr:hypothetical protein Mgra_00000740 [Meloidogyne graminicola]